MGVQSCRGTGQLTEELPLVSVIIPVFNGARFLRESLMSVVSQTYPNVEILILDDASTDATPDVVRDFADLVSYVRQERNVGQFRNVQTGISRAQGEFVCVYHADDVYLPDIVAKEVAYLQRFPEAGAVFCMDRFMDEDGTIYGELELPPGIRGGPPMEFAQILNGLLAHRNRFLRTPGAMVRREVYLEVGTYREDRFGMAADLDMWLRVARRYPVGILDEHLFHYRHTQGSEGHRAIHVRTEADLTFAVIDDHLDGEARRLVEPSAWREYEAHRQEDRIMIALNRYIRRDLAEMRRELARVDVRRLAAGRHVESARLSLLFVVLVCLSRLPYLPFVARWFYRRWHVRRWRNRR